MRDRNYGLVGVNWNRRPAATSPARDLALFSVISLGKLKAFQA